ncbi:hypothetical protein IFR05_008378 [Cadophora sp. M221]|nr:hypothetical protein IFR05_008378 [Cadophora sp. M221]
MLFLMLLLICARLPLLAATNTTSFHDASLMEFDLVFPRNETYAPTQYFPLVVAIRNSTATLPAGLILSITIQPASEEAPPPGSRFNFPPEGHTSGLPPSSPNFFAIAGTKLMNDTTSQFTVI